MKQRPATVDIDSEVDREIESAKIRRNSAWMIAEQVVRLSIAVLVTAWIARVLGPEDMGRLSFGLALFSMLGVVATVGLNRIAVREFVAHSAPDAERRLLATTLAMRWLAGGFMSVVAIITCAVLSPENLVLVAILAPGYFFTAFEVVGLLYQARQNSGAITITRLLAFAASTAIKICILAAGGGLVAITVACLIDWVFGGLALALLYRRHHPAVRLPRPDWKLARTLFSESRVEIIAGFSGMAFMRVDQIMLQAMREPSQVAMMAISSRLTEAWYFVPAAIVASTYPVIVQLQERDPEAASKRMRLLYRYLVLLSVAVGLVVTVVAAPVIELLYGAAYLQAAKVLVIQTWCGVFMSLGLASGAWLMSRREGVLNLRRNVLGMVVNVGFNLWLIPGYGAVGSAWATLCGFVAAYFVYDFLDPRARQMGREKLRGLAWR